MVAISNVANKYEAGKEASFGTEALSFNADFGHIQEVNISEEENMEKLSSINGGHTYNLFEDGLYWANISITLLATKSSLPTLLEMMLGTKTETTDYSVVSSLTNHSYSLNTSYTADRICKILGFSVKDWEISANKGDKLSITLNGIAQKVTTPVGTISKAANTSKVFTDLDAFVTVGGTQTVLNSFTINGNWNVTDDEGRGIEEVTAANRRLLTTFIKHTLDLSGSYEAEVDNNLEFGYVAERTDEAIVFTISRGDDNEHVFTMTNTRSNGRELGLSMDNSKRVVGYDYEALDLSVAGDL